MVEKGADALMRSLLKLPDHGRMRVPGHTGPDPHKVVLGWTLHYAWNVPDADGGQRIVLATDRYVSMWEARNNPRTMDYPFTLLEIRLDKNGEGVGKASIATKISFDRQALALHQLDAVSYVHCGPSAIQRLRDGTACRSRSL
jgi:hypothetical protein